MKQFRSCFGKQAWPWAIVVTTGLLLGMAGCSRTHQPDLDLVAKIGSREIRTAEFQTWMTRRATGNNLPEKVALLDEMLNHMALVERAKATGLDRNPELMRAWDNLLVSKLRELQLEPLLTNAEPSKVQIRTHYETNRSAFTEPAMRHGAMIYAELPKQLPADGGKRIRQRLLEARSKALVQSTNETSVRGFGRLAVEYSEDQITRYRGGDIGWVRSDRSDSRLDRAVINALFALPQTGAVSDVVETAHGLYVVKLLEDRPERVKPLDAVEPAIRHQLLVQNQQRLEFQWKEAARRAFPIEIQTNVLALISAPVETKLATNPPTLH